MYVQICPAEQLGVQSHSCWIKALQEEVDSTYPAHLLTSVPMQKLLMPWSYYSGWAFFFQRTTFLYGNIILTKSLKENFFKNLAG